MKNILVILAALLAIGPWTSSQGRTVDPYLAQVEVSDRSESQRRGGFDRALKQVLVKYSGREDIVRRINVGNASAGVQSFRYLNLSGNDDQSPARLMLEARFSPAFVRNAVSEHGLPVWPAERPEVLVWVAMEDLESGQRFIAGDSEADQTDWIELASRAADEKAVPLDFPLLDLGDQAAVDVEDIWQARIGPIASYSTSRYPAPYVLVGRVVPTGSGFFGTWTLRIDAETLSWDSRGGDMMAMLDDTMSNLASRLSTRFASTALDTGNRPGQGMQISVSNVTSAQLYGELMGYLERLSLVRDVSVLAVNGDTIELSLSGPLDSQSLDRVLGIDRYLEPLPNRGYGELNYRLERAFDR